VADRILTLREINRATLARQMLLERAALSVPQAIEGLVGLQAQLAVAPYVGLWTRLRDFRREHLADLIENHKVVKATLMRATLHLFTAEDYLRFRETLQPILSGASSAIAKQRGHELDIPKLLNAAREFIAEQPCSFAEISDMLTELVPDGDVGAMRYTVRTHLPLVQVPVNSGWSYPGNPKFTLAETWLGQKIPTKDHLPTLALRYLAAFGPARVTDMQTWSGLPKLKGLFEELRPKLVAYRDEQGVELFDLPDMPIPDADTPVPERFLPEFDNLLLSHSNRTRVVVDEYRAKVYLPGLRVAATILVDGFVRGAWKVEKKKSAATLTITPFAPLTKQNREALTEEGERLVRFLESSAITYEVCFAD
jgi:hypothetical protein